jgi:1-acyl-sn-glycerol-3-phosphate acyltransferase
LSRRINDVATDVLGTPPEVVVLAPPRTVPKTSSGKLRRNAAKALYEEGRIGAPPLGVRWQIARLALGGVAGQLRRAGRRLGDWCYAGWWWLDVGACYGLGWIAVMVLPRLEWRWAAARGFARAALAGMGVPLSVSGIERIPIRNAVLVFNHASYVDVVLVAAFLPGTPVFVAKKDLEPQRFAGPLLRRLGAAFVERDETGASVADAEAITRLAGDGHVLVFFPEGTFTRRPGLSEFHLGAFKIAAEAGRPIIPGILRGTRGMLRSEQWLPRRNAISMTIGEPIAPTGADFARVLRLRDAARAVILAGCGEPDLRELVKPSPPQASEA